MPKFVNMPEVLAGSAEASVNEWFKQVGDSVAVGDVLAEIETEKAIVEYQAEEAGVLARILVESGSVVPVGTPMLLLAVDGEDPTEVAQNDPVSSVPPQSVDAPLATEAASGSSTAQSPTGERSCDTACAPAPPTGQPLADEARLFASPLARRMARDNNIDLAAVVATGPAGRIVRRDIEAYLKQKAASVTPTEPAAAVPTADALHQPPTTEEGIRLPLSTMRRTIARRLTESKSQVPHFYVDAECRADELIALRTRINADVEDRSDRISLNDLLVKAAARALAEVPEAHVLWAGDHLRTFESIDIAVAVAIDGGLVTPVVRDVEGSSLSRLHSSIRELAERGRSGRLRPEELQGGTLAISNLGMYGTRSFSAILNPPQSAILAIGAAQQRPVVDDGALAVGTVIACTLSADHRAIDGAVAAQFMAAFTRIVESPLSILV